MVETRTIAEDAGKLCSNCGKDIYRTTVTWWIAHHGEYCSRECGKFGALALERAIEQLEREEKEGEGRQ